MTMIPVESNILASVGYDQATKKLKIVFTSGAVWRYNDVPKKVYDELLASDSKWNYMQSSVVGTYPGGRARRK